MLLSLLLVTLICATLFYFRASVESADEEMFMLSAMLRRGHRRCRCCRSRHATPLPLLAAAAASYAGLSMSPFSLYSSPPPHAATDAHFTLHALTRDTCYTLAPLDTRRHMRALDARRICSMRVRAGAVYAAAARSASASYMRRGARRVVGAVIIVTLVHYDAAMPAARYDGARCLLRDAR